MQIATLLLLPLAAIAAPLESRQMHQHGGPTGPAGGAGGLAGLLEGSGGLAGLLEGSGGLAGLLEGAGGSGGNPLAGLLGGGGSPLTPFKTYELEPAIRKDAKRKRFAWGPYELLPASAPKPRGSFSMDPKGQTFMTSVTGVPGPVGVIAGRVAMMYEDGTEATVESGLYTHHILTRAMGKKEVAFVGRCPSKDGKLPTTGSSSPFAGLNFGAGFIGTGEDNGNAPNMYTNEDGSYPSAFNIAANTTFGAQLDLVNYKETTQKLYMTFDIEYLDEPAENDAASTLLSVTGCSFGGSDGGIALSKDGPTETMSDKWAILSDGFIVSAKGHLHDGGVAMILYLNDKPVCTSEAIYGGSGGTAMVGDNEWQVLNGMTQCNEAIPVKRGDNISMKAIYDLAKHPLREDHGGAGHEDGHGLGVMGMFALSYAKGSDVVANATAPRR